MNEADTCRKYVVPKLTEAGWDDGPHQIAEQRYFTDGRIVVAGNKARRRPQKRADYLLRYRLLLSSSWPASFLREVQYQLSSRVGGSDDQRPCQRFLP